MKILLINGPNLNMLGNRDSGFYGSKSLNEIQEIIEEKAKYLSVDLINFQSNHEGEIVEFIQKNSSLASGIIINAGALTHYGISLRDSLSDSKLPFVEVHLSNIYSREEFRRISLLAPIALGVIAGLKFKGYEYAFDYLTNYLDQKDLQ
ncbi:MAG: type II 3-dehydroquinate dehydratase [SAR202 cluster bacterium]|nr:type II 3-dehydroquinate dehydratase [SAR202 cluster bacterium]|tara:strand:+ start:12347 stop:12793 length:447 start_codon:yes stop_codon:yes gene_type:complete